MKQWKKIIVFSILLVVLIAALIFSQFYKGNNSNADPTPTPANDPVLSVEEKDVSKITIENSDGRLEFVPGKGQDESGNETIVWKLSYPTDILFSTSIVTANAYNCILIPANTIVSTTGQKLAEYGLDKPLATVEIQLKTGVKKKILYGIKTAAVASYYVMLEGSNRICTTGFSNAKTALLKKLDILETAVMGGFTAAEAKEIQFKRKKDNVSFIAKSNEDGTADGQTPSSWSLISPVNIDASNDGFPALLNQLVAISADSFVEMAPKDLTKYGLDKPSYDITIIGDYKKVHCVLGGSPGYGQIYGYSDYIDAVFIFGTVTTITTIDKPMKELVSNFVVMNSIWDVTAIDMKFDSTVAHCDIKDDQEKAEASDFKVNGKNANVVNSQDDSYFRIFYQAVVGIFVKDFDIAAKPAYKPVITIDYTMVDTEKNVKTAYVVRDDSTFYCFINGTYAGFYVHKEDFYSEKAGDEGVIPAYNNLIEAMENQVNGVYK